MDGSLRRRLLSALLLAPGVLLLLGWKPLSATTLLAAVVVLSGVELHRLLYRLGWRLPAVLPLGALAFFAVTLFAPSDSWLVVPAAVVWVVPLVWLFRPRLPSGKGGGRDAWAVHLLGAAYLGIFLGCLARLETGPWSWAVPPLVGTRRIFYALAVVWASDTAAYLAGTTLGRRRMWPAVSPKKTWEGALGGWLAASLVAAALARPLGGGLEPLSGAILGAAAGIAAQLGDLIESRLKRMASVKDSGNFIPGHGGLLDRLDSLLFAAPLFYYGLNGFSL